MSDLVSDLQDNFGAKISLTDYTNPAVKEFGIFSTKSLITLSTNLIIFNLMIIYNCK